MSLGKVFEYNVAMKEKFDLTNEKYLIIHFIRHAHAVSNEAAEQYGHSAYRDEKYFDAKLTKKGEEQALKLKQVLEENGILKEVDTFYCSPLTRALKTCDLLLSETNANKNVYVFEHLRERIGGNPCDGRRGTNELKAEFHRFDFKNIEPKDPFPYTLPREEIPELIERSSNVLKRIKHHATSKQVVIVTHSSFLFKGIFAEGLLDCSEFPSASAWFENAEHKSLLIEFKEE